MLTCIIIVNRWLSSQFTMLSSAVVGIVGLIAVVTHLDASLSGFALSFAATITFDVSYQLGLPCSYL